MFKFKKIASVLASAIMLSSTIGFAAAASYPEPFVSGGTADAAVVYGAAAAISDLTSAIDLQEGLQALVTSTSSTGASTSGGDSQSLATGSRKLYYADAMNAARTALTSTEMGDVLADGTFTDLTGTAYDYTQTIKVGDVTSVFGSSGGDLGDPKLYINVRTAPNTAVLYNYTLSLTKNLNVSDATNVQGQKIKIFGIDYVIGASSTNTTLYLYGAGNTITVAGGESQTVDIGGTEHTVELISTDSATQGKVSVDGITKTVTKGSKYAFPGEVVVYVKDLTHPAFAGDIRNAELIMGANTLLLQNGQSVKQGADETSIKGTSATITAAGYGVISGITIQIAMAKSKVDHIAAGDMFVDPVFGGLEVTYAGAVPELDSDSRGNIVIDTDNNQYAYVTFTSARAGTAGEQKLAYVFDNNTASTATAPVLAHDAVNSDGKGYIHVMEGSQARENDWIVVNQGDAGTILEITDISHDTATSGSVTVEDVITGTSQKVTVTNTTGGTYSKTDVNFFGGTGYTVTTDANALRANITWSSAGTMSLYPRIKLKEGGWIAFMQSAIVPSGTTWILPNGKTALDTSGTAYTANANSSAMLNSTNDDGIVWMYTNTTNGQQVEFRGINSTQTSATNAFCNFSTGTGPAILILEPKKWDDATYGDHICVGLTTTGTTEIAIADPLFNGTNSGELTFSSNTYKSQFVDKFGVVVTKEDNTNENGIVTIGIPTDQMYLDVLFTASGVTVIPGSGGGTGTGQVVIVKDSEAGNVKAKNLIVVGGSCINTVAAKILGFDGPTCEAAFTTATEVGAGEFIIKVVKTSEAVSGGSVDKVAMLVAGYNAVDTVSAVTQAMDGVTADDGYSQVYPMTATTTEA